MDKPTFDMIFKAKNNLRGVIKQTDLVYAEALSVETGAEVFLKLENLQKSGSFKIRGAYNKMLNLSQSERDSGVVCSSAGNHAQGVAISASLLGIKSTIVMPKSAPFAKISATKNYGGNVVLEGNIYDDAYAKALEIQDLEGATFVHPFNDPYIIAGQGTIGLEMMQQQPDLDAIIVPIGGGGIAAGIALAVKTMNPHVQVIGVQSENAPSMYEAVKANTIGTVPVSRTVADGIAVARPGDLTFPLIQEYVDEVVVVSESDLAKAFLFLLETCNLIVEGAGAISVAALRNLSVRFKGKKVGAVLTGGNIDINLVESIINHALVASGRRIQIKTTVNHQPGELKRFLDIIANEGGNVLTVHQNRFREGLSMYQMGITLVMETIDGDHQKRVLDKLRESGYELRYIQK
ncbi:MAG: threonine ammonia-lyase [Turicibacter sp.]|nr:threonine ammonia-lyase [Turicibacter sp.]